MAAWFGTNVVLQVAYGDAPLTPDASCTWVDESAYLRSVRTFRGTTSDLSPVGPGTMALALDNSTRRFDPSNTAGAHYGELLPMTKVRLLGGASGTLVLFSGFALGWPITYPGMMDSVVNVQCVDAMRILEQAETPGSAYATAVLADSPIHYWPLQETDEAGISPAAVGNVDAITPVGFGAPVSLGFPVGESDGLASTATALSRGDVDVPAATFPATIEAWTGAGAYANPPGPASIGVVVSDTDAFYINLFENDFRVVYSHGGSRDTAGAGGVAFTYPTPTTSTPAHVTATVSGGTIYAYANGALVGSSALAAGSYSNGLGITNGLFVRLSAKPLGHVAFYGTALSATQVRTHYEAGTIAHGHPMGERTGDRIARILDTIGVTTTSALSTGSTVCGQWEPGGATALSQIRALEELEQGLFFIAADGTATFRDRNWLRVNTRAVTPRYTFGDGAGEIPYSDITIDGNHLEHIRNQVTVTYPASTITVKDATSIAAYGVQRDTVDATQLPTWNGWLARQVANYRLRARKDPATRIPSLTVDPRSPQTTIAAAIPAVTEIDLGDRVRVYRRPNGSTDPIQKDCHVMGIATAIDRSGTWSTELYLVPAVQSYSEAGNLLIGDATYGIVGNGYTSPY